MELNEGRGASPEHEFALRRGGKTSA
jgi:hypothetical protein